LWRGSRHGFETVPSKVRKLCLSIVRHNKIFNDKFRQITDPCQNNGKNDFKRFILDASPLDEIEATQVIAFHLSEILVGLD
jgi:hypothetical protein